VIIRRHPALVARILTAGLSAAAALGIVGAMARGAGPSGAAVPSDRAVEVRVGNEVDDAEARRAIRAWIERAGDLDTDVPLRVVDAPADTTSAPS
jgi:hypothetical protein